MRLLSIILFVTPLTVFAEVKLAFVEMRRPDGEIHRLEPNGRFAHIAISYRGLWLHTSPYYGVELTTTSALEKFGGLEIVVIPTAQEIDPLELEKYLGKKYDPTYSWDEDDGYYCSELVGKILRIEPKPMSFLASAWLDHKGHAPLGLSPDDIYAEVLNGKFHGKAILSCEALFAD